CTSKNGGPAKTSAARGPMWRPRPRRPSLRRPRPGVRPPGPRPPSEVLGPFQPVVPGLNERADGAVTRVGTALVDAHCHLGDGAFDADRPAVLARAARAAVGHIVVIG